MRSDIQSKRPRRRAHWWVLVSVAVVTAILVVRRSRSSRDGTAGFPPPVTGDHQESNVNPNELGIGSDPISSVTLPVRAHGQSTEAQLSEASHALRDWMILALLATGPVNSDLVTRWEGSRTRLLHSGAAAAAINEYLGTGAEILFSADGARLAGAGSMRAVLLNLLREIGGPEAETVLADALGTAQSPSEFRLIARNLEALTPGQHSTAILQAAQDFLDQVDSRNSVRMDPSPIFATLSQLAENATTAARIVAQANPKWGYYSAITLAALPGNAGVPYLVQQNQERSAGASSLALEMLGQLSAGSPEARAALLEEVRADRLSAHDWSQLAPILGGERYQLADAVQDAVARGAIASGIKATHIIDGDQNFFVGPPVNGWSAQQLEIQIGVVDELIGVSSVGPARTALEQARNQLLTLQPRP